MTVCDTSVIVTDFGTVVYVVTSIEISVVEVIFCRDASRDHHDYAHHHHHRTHHRDHADRIDSSVSRNEPSLHEPHVRR